MRITLDQLDLRKLELALPGDGARAKVLVLDALDLTFGTLHVTAPGGARLSGVRATYGADGDATTITFAAETLVADDLSVAAGSVRLSASIELGAVTATARGGTGSISAKRVALRAFKLTIDDFQLGAEALDGTDVVLSWGAPEFGLEAATVTTASADLSLTFAPKDASSSSRAAPAAPLFDRNTLDRLGGSIDVDLQVDLTLPIVGRRRATHEFRIRVIDGALDFMELENDLAMLENALLDFAVREGRLVLERGIPLLPTRGHGKPIVTWDLEPDDLALAEHNLVRLAVLPDARLAAD